MSEQAFVRTACELLEAVEKAFKDGPTLPGFILLFSSIDILASLTRPRTADDTSGQVFKDWVKTYMIAGDTTLQWNEEDLWGARCGLLHTYTVQSRSSRTGKARELHYIGTRELAVEVQHKLDPTCQTKVFVCISDLICRFLDAVSRFAEAVKSDPKLQSDVLHHSGRLIIHLKQPIS